TSSRKRSSLSPSGDGSAAGDGGLMGRTYHSVRGAGGIIVRGRVRGLEQRMIVERIWTGNAYRNYNYLIACPESGEALAIDPLDHEKCLDAARVKGWQITQV